MGLFTNEESRQQKDLNTELTITINRYQERTKRLAKHAQENADYLFEIEQQIEKKTQTLKEAIHELNNHMHSLEQEIQTLKHIFLNLVTSLKNYAKKDEIEKMKEFVEKITPLHYLTEEALEKMVQEKIQQMR